MQAVAATRSGISWPRTALMLLLGWWTVRLAAASPWIFLDLVNLPFHESGHLLFSFLGSTVHYLGGSLGQLLVPGLLTGYFLFRQRQPFSAAVCLWWTGQNFINIAVYMADARDLALPLVGGGDHDWNELFFRFGLLAEPSVQRVSSITHLVGVVVMLVGLLWGVYFVLPAQQRRSVQDHLTSRWPWIEPALEP